MITVRFPSGVAVQYNTVTDLQWLSDRVKLLCKDEKGQSWVVAHVLLSSGAIFEWVQPCAVTAPPLPSPDAAIDRLLELHQSGQLKDCASWKLRDLKRVLARFNGRSSCWK